jgi:hypothetical protein
MHDLEVEAAKACSRRIAWLALRWTTHAKYTTVECMLLKLKQQKHIVGACVVDIEMRIAFKLHRRSGSTLTILSSYLAGSSNNLAGGLGGDLGGVGKSGDAFH